MPIVVVLPIPAAILSPNARPHFMALANAKKKARQDASYAGLRAYRCMGFMQPPMWKYATVRADFYFARNCRRDKDNFSSRLKAYWDGLKCERIYTNRKGKIVQEPGCGILQDDDQLTHLPARFFIDKKNPRVELFIFGEGEAEELEKKK